jgi:DNA helicase-2/ATP-dependent DNA helicase PcrA
MPKPGSAPPPRAHAPDLPSPFLGDIDLPAAAEAPAETLVLPDGLSTCSPAPSPVSALLREAHLTDEQEQAVRHGSGPLLVFAGPGTGKTGTLTHRIGYLIEQRIAAPQRIVAMTFTRRATDEMRARLAELLGPQTASEVVVWTTHRLSWRMVRAHALRFGRDGNCVIHDPSTLARLARTLMKEPAHRDLAQRHAERDEPPVESLLAEISLAKNLLWTPTRYRAHGNHPAPELIASLWERLDQALRADNAFDLDDLLVYAAALLASDADVRDTYRERYEWMLIDEFQDLNPVQLEIVRQLMAPGGNLAAFADDDQSLYAFRGADPQNVLRFREDYPDAQTITLTRNWRSYSELVTAAGTLIERNEHRAPKPVVSARGPGGYIAVRRLRNDEEEASEVAALIMSAIAEGRDPTKILVLARTIAPLRCLQTQLVSRGIKVRLVGGQSLWERSEIKDAIAYLTLVANPYDAEMFERAVRAPADRRPFIKGSVTTPSRGIGDAGTAGIIALAQADGIDLIRASLRCSEIPAIRNNSRKRVREFAHALDAIRKTLDTEASRPSVSSLVDRTLHMHGGPIPTYEGLRDLAKDRRVRDDAIRVLEDLRSLSASAALYEKASSDEEPTITGFLASLGIEDAQELEAEEDDRVTLSTIHAAKGTEALFVIVIAVEQGLLPHRRQSQTRGGLEDERRLFYTALTRAADTVLFIYTDSRAGQPTDGPSCFLREAGLRR